MQKYLNLLYFIHYHPSAGCFTTGIQFSMQVSWRMFPKIFWNRWLKSFFVERVQQHWKLPKASRARSVFIEGSLYLQWAFVASSSKVRCIFVERSSVLPCTFADFLKIQCLWGISLRKGDEKGRDVSSLFLFKSFA